ncbi:MULTISPECIES: glycerol-3-phosphate 1-O-acyltransferase PlsY [Alteribacter]|uniref:Glycerol-3-phosphate acyltransferase n=1 Tax=Alteribacter keqinensis TaxID=2483800 RepID=A0A3M7TV70_9BACI|nr:MULTISPECIES: glycerol-3-phosphate 1-O-acyltransferase PlsY [Alteribacter]MBM7094669.1 glycerol-3-phosphate 1-O-acyltransferase PlsY [Alteribacter salitolerans]RNA69129.1 glycerol-3-phosphate 1-O-acyltransferase [Alteribacter keqinensis]
MYFIISVIVAYLLGSISFSVIIARKIMQVDIRQHGSGNAGATNTLRVLGVGPAIVVLLLDCLKGIIAVLGALYFTGGDAFIASAAGLAAIAGHNWPVYYGFRGGKGVATTIGVLASLVFLPALLAGAIAILSIIFTRFVSLGSLLFISGTTIIVFIFSLTGSYSSDYLYFLIVITVLSFWRHRTNIERLIKGTESKIGQKATAN